MSKKHRLESAPGLEGLLASVPVTMKMEPMRRGTFKAVSSDGSPGYVESGGKTTSEMYGKFFHILRLIYERNLRGTFPNSTIILTVRCNSQQQAWKRLSMFLVSIRNKTHGPMCFGRPRLWGRHGQV